MNIKRTNKQALIKGLLMSLIIALPLVTHAEVADSPFLILAYLVIPTLIVAIVAFIIAAIHNKISSSSKGNRTTIKILDFLVYGAFATMAVFFLLWLLQGDLNVVYLLFFPTLVGVYIYRRTKKHKVSKDHE